MKRIMVLGVSSGVGKSTFAKGLGERLGLDVYHLDRLFWKPDWKESTVEDFKKKIVRVIEEDEWIIDGNYSSTIQMRMERADTMIYLQLPLRTCLYRVVKRWLTNIGGIRSDMAEGCVEKVDWQFLKFIVTTYGRRKKKMRERMTVFKEKNSSNRVYALASKKEIQDFLYQMEKGGEVSGF